MTSFFTLSLYSSSSASLHHPRCSRNLRNRAIGLSILFRSSTSCLGRYANESSEVEWCPTLLKARIISQVICHTEGNQTGNEILINGMDRFRWCIGCGWWQRWLRHSPIGHCLHQYTAALLYATTSCFFHRTINSQHIIPIYANSINSVARSPRGYPIAVVLLRWGRGNREAIVPRDE